MNEVLQLALLGTATGGMYALLALGIVVINRASGVVNFAHAAIGVTAGYVFADLYSHSVATVPAAAMAFAAGTAVGLLVDLLVMRPLHRASPLTKAIGTIGVLVLLEAILDKAFGSDPRIVQPFLSTRPVTVLGLTVGADRLIILAISLALTALLYVVYRRTRFGLATSALAESSRSLSALGWSPARLRAANWAIAGALAAAAGILLSPILELQPTLCLLLIIPALGAALLGGLSSFPLTLVGGMLIAITQAELERYVQVQGIADAVPFFAVIVVLVLRGAALPARGHVSDRLPRVGSGRVPWVAIGGGLVVGVVLIQGVLPDDWVTAVTTCLVVGTVLLSLVVVTGYAGQLSLAQFALAGIGALVAARLVATAGWSIVPASIAGAAAAVPVGLVVGLPAVRTRGVNLGVITLGLAVAAQSLFFDNQTYTNGTDGLSVGSPHLFGINVDALLYPRRYATVALIIFALLGLGVLNLRRSAIGRKLVAVRANERAAASLGISVTATKLYAFVAAAVIAAVGGVLIAFQNEVVVFGGIGTSFDPFHSITAVAEATIGGVGYVGGALAGSTIEPGGVGQKLLDGISLGSWLPVIGGALLLFTIITAPDGIAANLQRQFSPLLARLPTLRRRRRSTPPVISGATPPLTQRAELIVEGVTVSFGAEPVVNDVSLTLRSGQVLGIIGANGAGKTTLVDAITGYAAPRRGSIRLDGREIGGLGPAARSRLGLVRSFQALELFEDLTVSDNLLAASEAAPWHRGLTAAAWPGSAQLSDSARVAVTQLGLEPHLDATPFDLSYGNRRLLAIARALAARPRVLLLDEPAAGLDQNERDELRALIRRLAETWQIAVLLIEHDVDLVLSVSDEVLALDFGRVIAAGAPTEVRGNREVISAYLGEEVPA